MSRVSILAILFLLLMIFPAAEVQAQFANDLLKVKELGTDFSSDKINVIPQAASANSLFLKIQSQDPIESTPSDLDSMLGIKFKGITLTDPENSANTFAVPINQSTPLSNLRGGVGLMLTPPNITPPTIPDVIFPGITLPPIEIPTIVFPEWITEKIRGGGAVIVDVQREGVDLSDGKSPDPDDWQRWLGTVTPQLRGEEQKANSLLKEQIRTRQPQRIQQRAQNQPPPVGGAPAPAAPALPIIPTFSGGIPCEDPPDPNNPGFKTAIGCIHTNPIEFVKDLLKFAVAIGGGFAFLMMLLGAYQMLTSAGNPDSLNAGRERLTSAVIGLLFVIFTILLMQIIGVGFLNLPGFGP